MINNKRVCKLKKDIKKKLGNIECIKFYVKTKEGLYLFNFNAPGVHHKDKYTKIDKVIEGLKLYDLSEYSIDDILIVGDGKSEPTVIIDDTPYKDKIIDGYMNYPDEPFKNFSNEELKEIANI